MCRRGRATATGRTDGRTDSGGGGEGRTGVSDILRSIETHGVDLTGPCAVPTAGGRLAKAGPPKCPPGPSCSLIYASPPSTANAIILRQRNIAAAMSGVGRTPLHGGPKNSTTGLGP